MYACHRYHQSHTEEEAFLLNHHHHLSVIDPLTRYRTSISKYRYALDSSHIGNDDDDDNNEHQHPTDNTILVRIRSVVLVSALSLHRLLYLLIDKPVVVDVANDNADGQYHFNYHDHNYHNRHANSGTNDDVNDQGLNDSATIISSIITTLSSISHHSIDDSLQLVHEIMYRHKDAFQQYITSSFPRGISACGMMTHQSNGYSDSDKESTPSECMASTHATSYLYYHELPEMMKILCELSYEVILIIVGDRVSPTVASMDRDDAMTHPNDDIQEDVAVANHSNHRVDLDGRHHHHHHHDLQSTSEHLIAMVDSSLDLLHLMVSSVYLPIVREMSIDFYLFCGELYKTG